MSEATILQIVNAILAAASVGFTAWLVAKYGQIKAQTARLEDGTRHVIRQNEVQEKKIDETKSEINGKVDLRIAAAVKEAIATAIREERLVVAEKLLLEKIAAEKK